jgi:diacylglycerol kinase (ATP)
MRAAAILGLGCSLRDLEPFRRISEDDFTVGLPASAAGLDAVLVFGGDGTVHRHLGALVRLGLPVLVVPAGSGNDFARALGMRGARDSREAWRRFVIGSATVRAIDLGLIRALDESPPADPAAGARPVSDEVPASKAMVHFFACVGGLGLDAEIARRANTLPRWLRRSGGYAMALPGALLRFAPFPMKLYTAQLDLSGTSAFQVHWHKPTMLAAFANTPFYGDGMKIAPAAKLDDGELDVCLIADIGSLKLLSLFPSVYFGRHLGIKEVEHFRTSAARIETEHPLDVYADGEFVCRTPAEFSVARGALRVITL